MVWVERATWAGRAAGAGVRWREKRVLGLRLVDCTMQPTSGNQTAASGKHNKHRQARDGGQEVVADTHVLTIIRRSVAAGVTVRKSPQMFHWPRHGRLVKRKMIKNTLF